jgi:hypothetical protein
MEVVSQFGHEESHRYMLSRKENERGGNCVLDFMSYLWR